MQMSSDTLTLKYLNEDDRAYGLAGMTISLAALDATDRVAEISLDSDGPMVTFSHQYYFCGTPSISPKATWNNLMENYYITSAMVLSNLMARSVVRLKLPELPQDVLQEVKSSIAEEGREVCGLEDDEIENLYQKIYTYMRRIFFNPRLHPAIREYVGILSRKRRLSGSDIYDELRLLRLI